MKKFKVFPDPDALAGEASALFNKIGLQAIQETGSFSVALAGGSTPIATYQVIANEAQRSAEIPPSSPVPSIDWSRVHFFWSDERCVPPDHPDSNYHMAWNALLNHLPVPYENLHRMEGELDPGLATQRYQDELGRILGSHPNIDLVLLGMGTDGHTASLFPGTPAVSNTKAWVAANFVQSMNTWRLTLTSVIINLARNVLFIVSGESKAGVLRQVFKGEYNPSLLPSQIINPVEGNLHWFVDKAAAKLLTQPPDPST